MRDVNGLIYETSLLDPIEGIRFRGLSIPEIRTSLPKMRDEPLPEGIFYLLLTGDIPTKAQVDAISADWHERATRNPLQPWLKKAIVDGAVHGQLHPMTLLSQAVLGLQSKSKFAAAYACGVHKTDLWEHAYEDTCDLIAALPEVASLIYENACLNRNINEAQRDGPDGNLDAREQGDWAGSFARHLAAVNRDIQEENGQFAELMRLYLTIHADHEGGNVSAHATKLVGSALADPYLAFSAGLNGLAGPLHGLANQEVLRWMFGMIDAIGLDATSESIEHYVQSQLEAGKVIPGYGHAVLRRTDPRYLCQREFALKHLPHDPLFRLCSVLYEVVPKVLTVQGRTKNPFPNVDAHSGVLLQHYGLKEQQFYTCLFGVSRAIGALAALIWDRALMAPLERPKSFTTEAIKAMIASKQI